MLKLKELRNNAGISIAALSKISGISHRTIEDIERRGDCRVSTAFELCKALNVPLSDIWKAAE